MIANTLERGAGEQRRNYIERPRCSCALTGAMTTVTAIPRGIPILHSSPGCAANTAWSQLGGGGLQVGGYCGTLSVAGTNVQERDVVFGGNERLHDVIQESFKVLDGDLYVVISGCIPAMIGDDINAVSSEFIEKGHPLVVAHTAGFKGCSHLGYDLALEAIINSFVKKGLKTKKGKVNLLGIVPSSDVFWRGNISGVKKLLELLGLEVNAFFSSEDNVAKIQKSSDAELTVVVSGAYGIRAAKAYESAHGIPWISLPLPIGPTESSEFLRAVAKKFRLNSAKTEKLIQTEENEYFNQISSLTDPFSDMDLQRYAVVIGDANYAASIPRFLAEDLGWLPELVICTEELEPEAKARVEAAVIEINPENRPYLVFDPIVDRAPEHLERRWPKNTGNRHPNPMSPAFVVGSSLDRAFAASIGAAHLSVSFPVANRAVIDRGYTGYAGGLHLTEDLLSAIVIGR